MYVQRSSGIVDIYRTSWMFFGPPKIGKTTLASGFPHPLFLVTSPKEVQALRVDYTVIDDWKKTLDVTKAVLRDPKYQRKYRYLVIDVVDVAWTNCIKEVCDRLDIKHPSEAGYGKGVDMIDLEFKKWITDLTSSDYGLIFVSHMQTREIISRGRTVQKTVSTLPDRARKIIIPLVSNIGYISMEMVKEVNKKGKSVLVERRCISFEPSPYLEAGHRDNVLPPSIVLPDNPQDAFAMLERYYHKPKNRKEGV